MSDEKSADIDRKGSNELAYADHLERGTTTTDGPDITPEHREYLLQRHGTLNLRPIPTADPADPYNWPSWKKHINLALVSFHAFMTTFIAAGPIPAFPPISEDLGVSLQQASYIASVQILILGLSPIFWRPISARFGRRPIWLISTFGAAICNIGNANCNSYASTIAVRILVSFFISPAMALGSGTVAETFFEHERGKKMGVWTLMVTLGPPTGPFIMGFVAYHVGWRWIYWIDAMINGAQFVLYLFFGYETLRSHTPVAPSETKPGFKSKLLTFHRINRQPFTFWSFFEPVRFFKYISVVVPTVSYTLVFCFNGVNLTVEIPQLFGEQYMFNPQQIGLQFIGMIVGSIIGEQMSGPLGDLLMNWRTKKLGHRPAPEYRLWASYLGFLTTIVGLMVTFVQLERTAHHYNVTPIVGIGIAAFGTQIVTTILVTYAVDCHPAHSASIGVFINLVRSTWSFIGPFFFPAMFTNLGLPGTGGCLCGLIAVFSVLPIMMIQWKESALVAKRKRKLEQTKEDTS